MKSRNRMFPQAVAAAVLSLAITASAGVYYRMLFERAVFLLETGMRPGDAAPIFQEIISRHRNDRYYAARSQFYLGLCHKRMGSGQASRAFQEVVDNYPDQTEVVEIARAELIDLKDPRSPAAEAVKPAPRLVRTFRKGHRTCDVSGEGRYLAFIDRETGVLMVHDCAQNVTRRISADLASLATAGFAEEAKISPDARRIAYSWRSDEGRVELRLVGMDGTGSRTLISSSEIPVLRPAGWASGGSGGDQVLAVLVGADLRTRVVLVSVVDGSVRPVADLGFRWPDPARLSPDGRYLAYAALAGEESSERDIFLFGIADKRTADVAVQPGDDRLIGWTADGRHILYASDREQSGDIWLIRVREGEPLPPARRIPSELGLIEPVALVSGTSGGTLYFEAEGEEIEGSGTGLRAWKISLPKENRTLTVPDEFPLIQDAVNAAASGDTVFIKKGRHSGNIAVAKPLVLRGEDRRTTIIQGGGAGDVVRVTASYVTISGITVTGGDRGLAIGFGRPVHHVTLRDMVVTQNSLSGISCFRTGGDHLIEDCVFSDNGEYALDLHQVSRSAIRNCEVFHNGNGLRPAWSWHVLMEGNRIHHNASHGILLDSCYYCTVGKNLITANGGSGIHLLYIAGRNIIRDNVLAENQRGVSLGLAWGGFGENQVYHNDFLGNRIQVSETDLSRARYQFWDNGRSSGGNHWSDYSGRDADHDGIGDSPHRLVGGAQDHFPLMKPRFPPPPGLTRGGPQGP